MLRPYAMAVPGILGGAWQPSFPEGHGRAMVFMSLRAALTSGSRIHVEQAQPQPRRPGALVVFAELEDFALFADGLDRQA